MHFWALSLQTKKATDLMGSLIYIKLWSQCWLKKRYIFPYTHFYNFPTLLWDIVIFCAQVLHLMSWTSRSLGGSGPGEEGLSHGKRMVLGSAHEVSSTWLFLQWVSFWWLCQELLFLCVWRELYLWRFCLLLAMSKHNRILLDAVVFECSSSSYRITIFLPVFVDLYCKCNLLILETNTKVGGSK